MADIPGDTEVMEVTMAMAKERLMLSQDMEDTVGDMEGTEVTVLTVTATLPLHTDTTAHTMARDPLRLNQATATDLTGDTEEATEVAMEVMAMEVMVMEDMVMAITESFSLSAQLRVQQVNWIQLHWR